jgi:hypothetical protein
VIEIKLHFLLQKIRGLDNKPDENEDFLGPTLKGFMILESKISGIKGSL